MKKVAFHTLGCKVNQYETEAMEELFEQSDYEVVGDEEVADVYVINTCTVTNMSARKSRQFIRRAKKLNEDSVVAVVGCYSQVSPEEIKDIDGVDVIMGTSERNRIVALCEEAKNLNEKINVVKNARDLDEFEEINVSNIDSMTRAYIKIQDGCNQFCSYCIIPYARGPIRSREVSDIIDEVTNLASLGFKEVVLTGIHVASYGKDLEDMNLGKIIDEISKIEGIERIRLSSVEPSIITDEFMETILKSGKVCDHFHLSLQSGSNGVLKRMNRKYTREEFLERVDTIRKYMPKAGITTDIIVGFPGETDEEFEETMDLVKKVKFSRIHVFKYSPREGTPAAKMKDQIHGEIKNERSAKLIELGEELAEDFSKELIGKNIEVLFEEEVEGFIEGYTSNYMRVKVKSDSDIIGKVMDIQILDEEDGILIGEV